MNFWVPQAAESLVELERGKLQSKIICVPSGNWEETLSSKMIHQSPFHLGAHVWVVK